MSKYPPHLLSCPIAQNGDKAAVPVTAQEAGAGRLSQEEGWGAWNSRPIGEGGIPPKREDFNSVLNLLSSFLVYYQQGGVMKYSASLDYEPGNEIFSATGVVAPGSDKTVWKNLDAPSVIAGQITPFYNCRLGGSDGRRLIPWGESVADERYVLCDGGTDGLGGNVPNLMDKFLLPSTVAQAGQTGGSLNLSIPGVTVNGTVGETVLTVEQMPAHTHTGSSSTAGAHTHTRGTMEITGAIPVDDHKIRYVEGAFYQNGNYSNCDNRDSENDSPRASFAASRTWSGETSSGGSHSHTMNLNSTGGGQGHTHTITSSSEAQTLTLDRPPFYRLAYFVKLPE